MRLPGNPVLTGLLAIATVATVALAWFGWRSLTQDADLRRQRSRELLDRAADTAAAGIRGRLAEAGERLSRGEMTAWEGAVTVRGRQVKPPGVLPFVPVGEEGEAVDPRIAEAERAEFSGKLAEAEGRYRVLGREPEALLRLGRVRRKRGDGAGAEAAYRELAALGDVRAGGVPAELAAWDGLGWAARVADGVDGGRWALTRGQAEFYRERGVARPLPAGWTLAEALEAAWGSPGVRLHGGRIVTMWRAGGTGAVGYLDALARPFVPAGYALAAGTEGLGAVRVLGDSGNSWPVRVWRVGPEEGGAGAGFVLAALGVVIAFLWGMVYLMARALRREAEAARLQTEFVANVSHEFRSPLTTVRQLAEMLEMGQVASEERRGRYYQVLAAEARRLQGLVETLLHFGRMEAGEARYRRERVLWADVAGRAVAEADGGARVTLDGDGETFVEGDAEALTVAVRNLVENALKYSAGPVEVRWGRDFVSVADHGAGIAEGERGRIFEKFVRGRAAAEGNVKGTGVGLAMVKRIAEAHGGEVRVESELGRGSVFTLRMGGA